MFKKQFFRKKIFALNCINEIISENDFNEYFYEFFIDKKKILDIFFDESTHDEIIRRSNDLFIYLAKYNKLNDDIINKLIQEKILQKKIGLMKMHLLWSKKIL